MNAFNQSSRSQMNMQLNSNSQLVREDDDKVGAAQFGQNNNRMSSLDFSFSNIRDIVDN